MTKKIFRSFMLSAVAVLLAGVVIVMTCLYSYFASVQESQLQDQLQLAAAAVETEGTDYLKGLTADRYRLTWIAADGTVLFDSVTACLSEQMFPGPAPDAGAANRVLRELLDISRYLDHFIAVCDDIWHGGEDYRDWTEVYVRGLADICQGLAAEFDVVCEMTAGLPHLWKGELPRV